MPLKALFLVCVRPGWNPNCRVSHAQANIKAVQSDILYSLCTESESE